jgi:Fe2+ transport system protein FeoA
LNSIPLNFLAPGQVAWIDQVQGTVEQVRRIEELGMQRGARIEMVRPGDVCIVAHDGRRLCFRGAESIRILVRPAADAASIVGLEEVAV